MEENDIFFEKKKDLIIKTILIIIIILLLLYNFKLIRKGSNIQSGTSKTGNIDVFEIKCNKITCKTKLNPSNNGWDRNKPVNDDNDKQGTDISVHDNPLKPIIDVVEPIINPVTPITPTEPIEPDTPIEPDEPEIEPDGIVYVKDNNITWSSNSELRIFSNPAYEMNNIIAPEDSNAYKFVISNNTDFNIKYTIDFTEENIHGINLKYKLKRGDVYVAGNNSTWLSYDELKQTDIYLESHSKDTYLLEWKWISSSNDNYVGSIKASYKLGINIDAEEVNE